MTAQSLRFINVVRLPRRRTRYVLCVTQQGRIEMRIPETWSDAKIEEILHRHRRWVVARQEELSIKRKDAIAKSKLDWTEIPEDWWRKAARPRLWKLLDKWSERMGVTVRKRRLTGARTRWGSCNSLGDISLSWRLMLVPKPLREYVVIHELAHRRHMNHGPRFWAEVAKYCPDYEKKRALLSSLGGDTQ
jgi:predicted metal-dependent hydrolase